MRIVTETGSEAVERYSIKLVQTPQAFHGKIILPAFFGIDYKDKFTDEASVVEAFGLCVSLVEGEEENIKLTRQTDMAIIEALLEKR